MYEQGKELAKDYNMKFLEASAKTNYNINEAFYELTRDILSSDILNVSVDKGIKINKEEKKEKQKCCK
jgi:Ras-related protein Rab-8A